MTSVTSELEHLNTGAGLSRTSFLWRKNKTTSNIISELVKKEEEEEEERTNIQNVCRSASLGPLGTMISKGPLPL